MFTVGDFVADEIIRDLSAKQEEARLAITRLRGPEHALERKIYRERIADYSQVISGLNTGEGVTRRTIKW